MRGKFEQIVSVVLVNKEGGLYTARMKEGADNRLAPNNERHFIGGAILEGESPEQAAKNRLREKTGVSIQIDEALSVTQRSENSQQNDGIITVTTFWFIASIVNDNEPEIRPDTDIEEGLWATFQELCDSDSELCLGDVAWDRTPAPLLTRTFLVKELPVSVP